MELDCLMRSRSNGWVPELVASRLKRKNCFLITCFEEFSPDWGDLDQIARIYPRKPECTHHLFEHTGKSWALRLGYA